MKSQLRLEDQPWYDSGLIFGVINRNDKNRLTGEIWLEIIPSSLPGEVHNRVWVLKIMEGGEPSERYRLFLDRQDAEGQRVLRGLERPKGRIKFKYAFYNTQEEARGMAMLRGYTP